MAQAGDGQMCDAVIDRGTLLAIMQAAKKADDSLLRDYAETTVAVADIKIAVRSMKNCIHTYIIPGCPTLKFLQKRAK